MYYVKVTRGTERIQVRRYNNGFLPSYQPGGAGAGKGRELIVPGAVFMLTKATRSELVPEEDWKVIDALSDSRISMIGEDGTFVSGPLRGMDHLISRTDREHRAVQIKAKLLGEPRDYWIRVQWAEDAEPEASAEENRPDKEAKGTGKKNQQIPDQSKAEDTRMKKEKTVYTDEQNAKMLDRAAEIGVKAAAAELGVTWQYIAQLKRRSGAEKKAPAAAEEAAPAKRGRKKSSKASAETDELDALKAENAVLRAENSKLEKQIAKLKKAIQELLD